MAKSNLNCLTAVYLATAVLIALVSGATAVVVHAPTGTLVGFTEDGSDRFLGIPFGEPPTGNMRWQPPVKKAPWKGVRPAIDFGADCVSSPDDYVEYKQAEDCLYLNVYRPGWATSDSKLPVLHFLYGGSFQSGGSSFILYHGHELAMRYNVIVVTSNYRLDVFGFLAGKALQANTTDGSTGNFGLQDQRLAAKWIKDNIAAFGGDPSHVLLFGQSAGSGSVANHLVMPKSAGLFNTAIMESGPACPWASRNMTLAEDTFNIIVSRVNCSSAQDVMACLRKVDVKALIQASKGIHVTFLGWSPVVDGVELTNSTEGLWETGKINDVDAIMLGTVKDEGTEFVDVHQDMNTSDYASYVTTRYGEAVGKKVLELYPLSDYQSPFFAVSTIWGDSLMTCPARRTAKWALAKSIKTHLYFFTHLDIVAPYLFPGDGVGHSSELPFVFSFRPFLLNEGERNLAVTMGKYWTNLARATTPNHPNATTTEWAPFDDTDNTYLQIDLNQTVKTNNRKPQCDFWDQLHARGCDILNCPCSCDLSDL